MGMLSGLLLSTGSFFVFCNWESLAARFYIDWDVLLGTAGFFDSLERVLFLLPNMKEDFLLFWCLCLCTLRLTGWGVGMGERDLRGSVGV